MQLLYIHHAAQSWALNPQIKRVELQPPLSFLLIHLLFCPSRPYLQGRIADKLRPGASSVHSREIDSVNGGTAVWCFIVFTTKVEHLNMQ